MAEKLNGRNPLTDLVRDFESSRQRQAIRAEAAAVARTATGAEELPADSSETLAVRYLRAAVRLYSGHSAPEGMAELVEAYLCIPEGRVRRLDEWLAASQELAAAQEIKP